MSELKMTLKAARVNAGLTQRKAAETLGIATATLVSWEKHPEKISAAKQKDIADTYSVGIDNIIFLPSN